MDKEELKMKESREKLCCFHCEALDTLISSVRARGLYYFVCPECLKEKYEKIYDGWKLKNAEVKEK